MAKVELSAKERRNAIQELLKKVGNLSQVCKLFDGLYAEKLESCKGLSVEDFMSVLGVERLVVEKNRKIKGEVKVVQEKKGYTPATIRKGWNAQMINEETGNLCTFKSVKAKYKCADGKVESVYTEAEAKKVNGKAISRYMLVEVEANKWDAKTIFRGLEQKNDVKKHQEKVEKSATEWAGVEKCYIRKASNDGSKYVVTEIKWDEVYF